MNALSKRTRIDYAKSYLNSISFYLFIIVALFISSIIIGAVYSSMNPEIAQQSMEEFRNMVDFIKSLPPYAIMLFIFVNNTVKTLIALLLGIGFGIIPFAFIAYNGYIIGVFGFITAMEKGLFYLVTALLPHGIIELPMVFISTAIGLKLGHEMINSVTGRKANIKEELSRGIRFYFYWIVPLLFVAAAIETFITPTLIQLIL
ncbi:stage II sporulation protein M [Methanohalobium sp.]|uniref:stage II sporulation protein M n=1 Tax=Methanohalobium sp. TaxID=2837493 RepID=UPI0025FF65EF|nr:stage II sporulation protein M [Methanohalobium sp.]